MRGSIFPRLELAQADLRKPLGQARVPDVGCIETRNVISGKSMSLQSASLSSSRKPFTKCIFLAARATVKC